MRFFEAFDGGAGACQQGGVVQWMIRQQHFQIRRLGGIEMRTAMVNQKTQRRLASTAGMLGA